MSTIQFIGFSPDLDPAQPGVVTDCQQMIPTNNGMAASPTPVDAGLAALDSACKGAFVGTLLDGTRRAVAGTTAKLWDISAGVWTDRSQVGGYTGANRWRFTMFGNNVLACNRAQRIQ